MYKRGREVIGTLAVKVKWYYVFISFFILKRFLKVICISKEGLDHLGERNERD